MLDAGVPYILETGPMLISGLLNWGLMGILVVQIYTYLQWYYHTDVGVVRALAVGLFVLELLQTVFTTHTCWVILVLQWGNPLVFTNTPWSAVTVPILSGIVASMVQLFFARRIWMLGKGVIFQCITVLVAVLSLVQCASSLAFGAEFSIHANRDPEQLVRYKWLSLVWLVTCFVCDLSIAATLVYIFFRSKNDFVAETNALLDRLIMRTIQSGVLTAAVAALHIAMFLKYPNTFLDLPPVYTIGKLYANIVFANLNGRKRQSQVYDIETSGISLEFRNKRNHTHSSATAQAESGGGIHSSTVHITRDVTTDADDNSYASKKHTHAM